MTMLGIALNSLRFRLGRFTATFINVFLGAIVLTAFASLFDIANGTGVSAADKSSLSTIAGAVGGWGLIIVVFGVASTMSLSTRQRHHELALLKAVGATPSQIGRMIVGEGIVVAVIASCVAIAPVMLIGRIILRALQSTDQIAESVQYAFGPLAPITGVSVTLVATVGAASIAARRAGRFTARDALTQSSTEGSKINKVRLIAGIVLAAIGVLLATLTGTVLKDEGFLTLSSAGQATIATAIGLALLSPLFLGGVIMPVKALMRFFTGASGYLAATNIRQRTDQTAAITMPIVVYTGLATVSLYTLKIQNAANAAEGITLSDEDKGVQTLTFVIVGMIAVFAAIVVVNNCVATVLGRRAEFALARRIGATPCQLRRATALEALFAIIIGVMLGTIAALIGIAGFAYGRTGSFTIDAGLNTFLVIAAAIVFLTLAATLISTMRSIAEPMMSDTASTQL